MERKDAVSQARGPLQHGSLTYPQFTSDYYALYTYAAFLSRLSPLLLRFSTVLPFSPLLLSLSFSLRPLASFPVRESSQASIYAGTRSLHSRRYVPWSRFGHHSISGHSLPLSRRLPPNLPSQRTRVLARNTSEIQGFFARNATLGWLAGSIIGKEQADSGSRVRPSAMYSASRYPSTSLVIVKRKLASASSPGISIFSKLIARSVTTPLLLIRYSAMYSMEHLGRFLRFDRAARHGEKGGKKDDKTGLDFLDSRGALASVNKPR